MEQISVQNELWTFIDSLVGNGYAVVIIAGTEF